MITFKPLTLAIFLVGSLTQLEAQTQKHPSRCQAEFLGISWRRYKARLPRQTTGCFERPGVRWTPAVLSGVSR